MTVYASILGHRRAIGQLKRVRESGRVAHAYLFSGPDGVGKERVAFAFAQALNCVGDDSPCGNCDACSRIAKGVHPDVRLLASEEELTLRGHLEREKGRLPSAQIKNAQLDDLADLFRHRPYSGHFKVVVAIDADKMNVHAQNRFLKTLEEPSDDSVIVLVTAHPEALLPTVRSRCQTLSFGPLARDAIAGYLRDSLGVPTDRARVLASMSQGSLGSAVRLAEGDVLQVRDALVEGLSRMRRGDLADLLLMAQEQGRDRSGLADALNLMEIWLRDLLLARAGVSSDLSINQDQSELVTDEAGRLSGREVLGCIERIRRTRSDLRVNANPRMAAESLLLDMRSM